MHQWLKKAVLLSFRLNDSCRCDGGTGAPVYDKVPLEDRGLGRQPVRRGRLPRGARRGGPPRAYIAPGVVLMPSFVNVGAYVEPRHHGGHLGDGRQLRPDRQATATSRGGVGIGGVLEPLQAEPVIIEDDCFIGARSEVVEGVIVERGACWRWACSSAPRPRSSTGHRRDLRAACRPIRSSCPGTLPGQAAARTARPGPASDCAVIVKRVDAQTRAKTSINELLRD